MVNLTRRRLWAGPRSWRGCWTLGMVVLLLSATHAQSPAASEYQIKAAFLFNFAKFVEWPASSFSNASAPLRICVLGRDPFGDELMNIAKGKTVNGRGLEVDPGVDLQVARTCQILFISSSEKSHMRRVLDSLSGTSVLTVAENEGFAERGGMINFVLENSRVQFEVNRKVAEQCGLKISSKLLSVAKLVLG